MIEVRSNATQVGALLKEIATMPEKQARALQGVIGNTMRKDVRTSIQGKGPIPVAPKGDIAIAVSKMRRRPAALGGNLPNYIWWRRGNKGSVMVGPKDDRTAQVFESFQSAEARDFTRSEAITIGKALRQDERASMELEDKGIYSAAHAASIANQYVLDKGLRLNRPARPIIQPLADSPRLLKRLKDAVEKRLNRELRRAAKAAGKAA